MLNKLDRNDLDLLLQQVAADYSFDQEIGEQAYQMLNFHLFRVQIP